MEFNALLSFFDLLGTFAFALSGAIAGTGKKMDLFGMYVLSLATAVGGSTLRSILIGNRPLSILVDPNYLIVCLLATILVFYFRNQISNYRKTLLFYDAFGLGIFLSIGVTVSIQAGLSYWASIIMGVITASFGGVMRDIFSAEIPLIFKRELYATVCLAGGLIYIALSYLNFSRELIILSSAAFVFVFRIIAIQYNLRLPK